MSKEFLIGAIITLIGIICGTVIPLIIAIVDRQKAHKKAEEEREKARIARSEADAREAEAREFESESEIAQAEAEAEKQKRIAAEADAAAREAEAEAELNKLAIQLVDETETLYKEVDKQLRQTKGHGAGEVKKSEVMTKMEISALKSGYPFDAEKWSGVVDGIVKVTKNVNGCK